MNYDLLFSQSYNFLKKNKFFTVPFILSQFFLYFVFILLLFLGIFTQTNVIGEYQDYSSNIIQNVEYSFIEHLNEKDFFSKYNSIFIFNMIIYVIFSYFIAILVAAFFTNIGFYQNISALTNIGYKESFKEKILNSKRYYLKYIFVKILGYFIIFSPVLLLLFFTFLLLFISPILFILGILVALILMTLWIIFMSVRIFFAEVIIYTKEKINSGVIEILLFSYKQSKNKFKSIILIALIIIGINSFAQAITTRPITELIFNLIFTSNIYIIFLLLMLLFILFSILIGIINTFTNIYMIKAYTELKNEKNDDNIFNS